MAFDMGRELAEAEDVKVGTVVVDDDVAVKDSTYTVGRRGVAGNFFVIKALGAAAERATTSTQLVALGERVNSVTRSMGMALTSCTPPAKGSPLFDLGGDEIEMGVGIHGEPGRRREKLKSAEILDEMLEAVVTDLPYESGDEVALMINGLGGADIRALHPLRTRTTSSRSAASPSGAPMSASTARRSTWPEPRSRSSRSTTSSRSSSRRLRRSRRASF